MIDLIDWEQIVGWAKIMLLYGAMSHFAISPILWNRRAIKNNKEAIENQDKALLMLIHANSIYDDAWDQKQRYERLLRELEP